MAAAAAAGKIPTEWSRDQFLPRAGRRNGHPPAVRHDRTCSCVHIVVAGSEREWPQPSYHHQSLLDRRRRIRDHEFVRVLSDGLWVKKKEPRSGVEFVRDGGWP